MFGVDLCLSQKEQEEKRQRQQLEKLQKDMQQNPAKSAVVLDASAPKTALPKKSNKPSSSDNNNSKRKIPAEGAEDPDIAEFYRDDGAEDAFEEDEEGFADHTFGARSWRGNPFEPGSDDDDEDYLEEDEYNPEEGLWKGGEKKRGGGDEKRRRKGGRMEARKEGSGVLVKSYFFFLPTDMERVD